MSQKTKPFEPTSRNPEVSFVETMRGQVETPDGKKTTIEFDVCAESHSLKEFARSGLTELSGLLRAPLWINETPVRGSLRISPGALVYHVRFDDRAGNHLVLEGLKKPSLFAPLNSMTVMQTTVRDEQSNILAKGTMTFDMADIVPFVLSWLPGASKARKALFTRRLAAERFRLDVGEPAPVLPAQEQMPVQSGLQTTLEMALAANDLTRAS